MSATDKTHPSHPPDPLFTLFHAKPLFPSDRAPLVGVDQKLGVETKDETREGFGILVLVIRVIFLLGHLLVLVLLLLRCRLGGDGS